MQAFKWFFVVKKFKEDLHTTLVYIWAMFSSAAGIASFIFYAYADLVPPHTFWIGQGLNVATNFTLLGLGYLQAASMSVLSI